MNRCGAAFPIIFVTLLIAALGLSFGYIFNRKLFKVEPQLSLRII